jgi:hypothetical protein
MLIVLATVLSASVKENQVGWWTLKSPSIRQSTMRVRALNKSRDDQGRQKKAEGKYRLIEHVKTNYLLSNCCQNYTIESQDFKVVTKCHFGPNWIVEQQPSTNMTKKPIFAVNFSSSWS